MDQNPSSPENVQGQSGNGSSKGKPYQRRPQLAIMIDRFALDESFFRSQLGELVSGGSNPSFSIEYLRRYVEAAKRASSTAEGAIRFLSTQQGPAQSQASAPPSQAKK